MLIQAFPGSKPAGFTLIELLTAVAVLAVLISLGMPSFVQMLRNIEVRAAAESIANGLQRARAEAVARNARVQFVLSPADTSWTVDYVVKPNPADPAIDSRSASEGSPNVGRTPVPGTATTITFTNLGGIWVNPNPLCAGPFNADCTATLTQVNFSSPGSNEALQIRIGAGGSARVCDPSPRFVAPHPRAC